jgi:hypothetical protein
LPLQQRGFNESTPTAGGLMHIFSEAAVEGFSYIQKITVEINIFVSTLCLIKFELIRWQQWWPKRHPLLLAVAHNIQLD